LCLADQEGRWMGEIIYASRLVRIDRFADN
jgi:hypothetical protein